MKFIYSIILWVLLLSGFPAKAQDINVSGSDGPYIIYQNGKLSRFIKVDNNGKLLDTLVTLNYLNNMLISSDNSEYRFSVGLHEYKNDKSVIRAPEKIFVISDPHADMDSFISILKAGKIIDDNLKWVYSKNHLVISGDVFDRGDDVTTIFWLIYKLEKEATSAGGMIHFLIGNHESMVLQNNLKYATDKYKILAKKLNIRYSDLWSPYSELGKWLRTKNTIQIIGQTLFVHGGISEEVMKSGLSIKDINRIVSTNLGLSKDELKQKGGITDIIFGSNGPLWYRGMVLNDEKYSPISQETFDNILKRYKVNRIIVGHTTLNMVTLHHSGKVISIDAYRNNNPEKHLGGAIEISGSTGSVRIVTDSVL